jgi:glycerophosphoryl diester phosphodiesterase
MLINTGHSIQPLEYIAHRGASYLAPENTMSSVALAWQLGADAVEVDVYLTRDNRIAVIHDKNTHRVSGVDLEVSQSSLEELQKLDVGRWKDKKYAGEKIPSLEDVIETIPKSKKLFIEIKCGREILPFLDSVISQSGKRSQITVICFDLEVLAKAKSRMPDIPAYWLVGTEKNKITNKPNPHCPDLLDKVRQNKIDGLNVNYEGINELFVKAVRNSGQALYVWTVDNPETSQRLIQLGVRGITTNRPKWLKEQLEKGGAS